MSLSLCPSKGSKFLVVYILLAKSKGIIICYVFKLLQGRALLNAVGNLEISGAYAEALKKLGHNLEDVARQVRFTDHLIEL